MKTTIVATGFVLVMLMHAGAMWLCFYISPVLGAMYVVALAFGLIAVVGMWLLMRLH